MVPGRRALVAVLALAAAAGGARAAVTSVGATGFAIQHAVDVRATPARAWKALVDPVLVRQLERLRSYLDTGRPGSPNP